MLKPIHFLLMNKNLDILPTEGNHSSLAFLYGQVALQNTPTISANSWS